MTYQPWKLTPPNSGEYLYKLNNSVFVNVNDSESGIKDQIRAGLQQKKHYAKARTNRGQYVNLIKKSKKTGEYIDLKKFKDKIGFCQNHNNPVFSHCSHPRLCEDCIVDILYSRITNMRYSIPVKVKGLNKYISGIYDITSKIGIVIAGTDILVYPDIDTDSFNPITTNNTPYLLDNAVMQSIYSEEELVLVCDKNDPKPVELQKSHIGYIYGMSICKNVMFNSCKSKPHISIYNYDVRESFDKLFTYDQCYHCIQKNRLFDQHALKNNNHITTTSIGVDMSSINQKKLIKHLKRENRQLKKSLTNVQVNTGVSSDEISILREKLEAERANNAILHQQLENAMSQIDKYQRRYDHILIEYNSLHSSVDEKCSEYIDSVYQIIQAQEVSMLDTMKKSSREKYRELAAVRNKFLNSFS